MKERIGFIGLGVMGSPMAGHLVQSGYTLSVNDIDSAAMRSFCALYPDVKSVDTACEIAAHSDIIFTMLPDGRRMHPWREERPGQAYCTKVLRRAESRVRLLGVSILNKAKPLSAMAANRTLFGTGNSINQDFRLI